MKHRKQYRKKQSPSEIKKQILEQLRTESDLMAREILQQRLHHYNTLIKNPKNQ
jgi:hypothetical protein